MSYEAVIFDVSDTLIEYRPNYAEIFGARLRRLGYQVSQEKANYISRIVNWTIGEQTRKEQYGEPPMTQPELNSLLDKAALSCITSDNTCIEKQVTELKAIEIPKQEMHIIPGVIEVLTTLKNKYRLGIVSNHYSWLMDYLNISGLAQYFETIIISEIVGVSKPNIQIMQFALDDLGLEAEKCVYVGDQPYDILCSKQSGMDCVWITQDEVELPETIHYKEDFRISEITDLLKIL